MRSRVSLTIAACALTLLSGCGGGEPGEATDDPTSPASSETSTEPTDTPSATDTTEPTEPTEPTDTPTDTPTDAPTETPTPTVEPTDGPSSPPGGLRAALLTAETLPAPGDVVWEPGTIRRGTGPDDLSVCQVVELKSLGSTKGVTGRFRSGSVEATHVVAQFVDELGASQGYAVLEAWLSRCAKQARTRGFEVSRSPGAYIPAEGGDGAGWALLFYGPVPGEPDAAYIEAQSLVRVGDTLSWVVWTQIGQDYNYEPGQTPPERALPLMAEALTGS